MRERHSTSDNTAYTLRTYALAFRNITPFGRNFVYPLAVRLCGKPKQMSILFSPKNLENLGLAQNRCLPSPEMVIEVTLTESRYASDSALQALWH